MQELLDKIGFLLLPKNFETIFLNCFWYWLVLTLLCVYVFKGRK